MANDGITPSKLIAQLCEFKTTKDGGAKVTFEFGQESIEESKKIIDWNKEENLFVVVVAPFKENKTSTTREDLGL
jgi:hypothetical protein